MAHMIAGIRLLGLGGVLLLAPLPALADPAFKMEGNFLRNQVCKGDGSESEPLRVRITGDQIFYAGGVCTIDERKQEEATIAMRVTCKFKSGTVLSSNITFTKRDETSVDMAQIDGSY